MENIDEQRALAAFFPRQRRPYGAGVVEEAHTASAPPTSASQESSQTGSAHFKDPTTAAETPALGDQLPRLSGSGEETPQDNQGPRKRSNDQGVSVPKGRTSAHHMINSDENASHASPLPTPFTADRTRVPGPTGRPRSHNTTTRRNPTSRNRVIVAAARKQAPTRLEAAERHVQELMALRLEPALAAATHREREQDVHWRLLIEKRVLTDLLGGEVRTLNLFRQSRRLGRDTTVAEAVLLTRVRMVDNRVKAVTSEIKAFEELQ